LSLSEPELAKLLGGVEIVTNAIGILQGAESGAVHREFAARVAAICSITPARLLVHLSVPGEENDDCLKFSRTKREGDRAIVASGAPFVILRPGFVIATAAIGGSALVRALAALPFDLPLRERSACFAATAISDLCETVARVVSRWGGGEKGWRKICDVMEELPGTVSEIVADFRAQNGGR
jgi:uncharacterized protein YbjT (DUF2867 family)